MNKISKRLISSILAVTLILMLPPVLSPPVFADSPEGNWTDDETFYSEPERSGDIYTVDSDTELAWVAAQVDSGATSFSGCTIELSDDIDLSEHFWVPIGNKSSNFKGTFDGNGHTITGLRIGTSDSHDTTTVYAGLFGYVNHAWIRNVSVDVSIYASFNLTYDDVGQIGGITGYMEYSTIEDCSVTGSLTSDGNGSALGGFVGSAIGSTNHSGEIKNCHSSASVTSSALAAGGFAGILAGVSTVNCYATGTVTGGFSFIGGFAGQLESTASKASLINCYATGSVTASDGDCVGGLIGYLYVWSNDVTVANCSAAGNVTGSDEDKDYSGGLFGFAKNTSSKKTLTITNCYAAGAVEGGSTGGVLGHAEGSSMLAVSNCFWNSEASGTDATLGNGSDPSNTGTISMTASDMRDAAFANTLNDNALAIIFEDDDLALVGWKPVTGSYPVLNGVGNSEKNMVPAVDNVEISGKAEQGKVLTASYDYADLNGDSDHSTYRWYRAEDEEGTNAGEIAGAADLNYTLTAADGGYYIGFEVTPHDGTAAGETKAASYIGPVRATNYWTDFAAEAFDGGSGTETDPYQINTPGQLAYLAKLVNDGEADAANGGMQYAELFYAVTGPLDLSGHDWFPIGDYNPFAGCFDGGEYLISNLKIGSSEYMDNNFRMAGLFGHAEGIIRNVNVQVEVYSEATGVGGIAGMLIAAELSESKVSGIVQGGSNTEMVGGAVGYAGDTSFKDNSASADVSARSNSFAGGFIGYAHTSEAEMIITNCFASGDVTGMMSGSAYYILTGGFAGYMVADEYAITVVNCCATGDVTKTGSVDSANAGGFVGSERNSLFQNCYATGVITAEGYSAAGGPVVVGGFVGTSDTVASNTYTDTYWNMNGADSGIGYAEDTTPEVIGISSDDMKKTAFAETLNGNAQALMAENSSLSLSMWKLITGFDYPVPDFLSEEEDGDPDPNNGGNGGHGSGSGGSGNSGNDSSGKATIKSSDGKSVEGTLTKTDSKAKMELKRADFNDLANKSKGNVTISLGMGSITFSGKSIDAISGTSNNGDISLEMELIDTSDLQAAIRSKIGKHPVYDFTLMAGKTQITKLGGKAVISIPYTPEAGENRHAIVVYYLDDAGNISMVRGRYNEKTGMVTFVTTHFSMYAVGYNEITFTDVAQTAWYHDAVTFCAARGITSGAGNGAFEPNAALTRGQFLVMVMRAYGMEAETTVMDNFDDAGNTYYTGYLAAAKTAGITNGVGNNSFAPEQVITRQDMFTLLYRILDGLDELPDADNKIVAADFEDCSKISDYAADPMNVFVKSGIVSGSGGMLNPKESSTRAQMVTVLYNLLSETAL